MMYEIRKRSTTQPDIWYPVAWSDMRVYAEKIAELMNVYEDGEFAVFKTNTPSTSGEANQKGRAGRKRPEVTGAERTLGWKGGKHSEGRKQPCDRGAGRAGT